MNTTQFKRADMQHQKRKKFLTHITAAVLSTGIAACTFAADDYPRIKKDINVMIGIVKSSFEDSKDCKGCKVQITGHYLVEQGAVFNVNPKTRYQYAYAPDVDFGSSIAVIPDLVHEIIEDVQININGNDVTMWEWDSDSDWEDTQRAREEFREMRREMRELSREMRELEIEAIHADEDELKTLEDREQQLESRIAEIEAKQEKVELTITKHKESREQELEQKKAEKLEQQKQKFVKMENILLNTFCDYSSTMRNLPDDEKISIIVNTATDNSNIYVFKQSDLADCDSTKTDVRKHALSYAF